MKSNKLNKVPGRQPTQVLHRIDAVMPPAVHTNTNLVHQQNISFYDEIAGKYDEAMAREASNELVRQAVRDLLARSIPAAGAVLDFGGGTGLDLGWLTERGYDITFCEPSAGMRSAAIKYNKEILHNHRILFLEDGQTDFTRWQQHLPFTRQVDAVLANFGVLNAIPDIPLLFKNLSLVIKPGGHLLITILERPFKKMWQWHRRNALVTLLSGKPFIMYVWHQTHRQTVYVHTPKAIQQAAASCFELRDCKPVNGTSFILLHLVKK